ncbi:hypothetical protein SAMN05444747_103166 [Variovorax sp. OV329]|nr:hypothetical protein SAMN05444747_103166 [Variovorax sp. OV329]
MRAFPMPGYGMLASRPQSARRRRWRVPAHSGSSSPSDNDTTVSACALTGLQVRIRQHHLQIRSMSRYFARAAVVLCAAGCAGWSVAGEQFTGSWYIDLRTAAEKKSGVKCGRAYFELRQTGDDIAGSHGMATASCGRMNEGGPVRGVVVGRTAVLVVTSGRNDAIAMGTATLSNGKLKWRQIEEIRAGSPEGDSPLILGSGILARSKP